MTKMTESMGNRKNGVNINRKEVLVASKEPCVFNWLEEYLKHCNRDKRFYFMPATLEEHIDSRIEKPEAAVVFLEPYFYGERTGKMLKLLKRHNPRIRIVMFSVYDIPAEQIALFMNCGADGYINLRDSSEQIWDQITDVFNGKRSLPHGMWQKIDEYYEFLGEQPQLTQKEIEVVGCLAEGKTKKEVGEVLRITTKTVDNHVSNIYRKFGVHNSVGLLRLAISNGIISV
jgi:DNA-binding NarL/FixJ family response regulator